MFNDFLNLFLNFGINFFNFLGTLSFGGTSYLIFVFAVFIVLILIDNFVPRG